MSTLDEPTPAVAVQAVVAQSALTEPRAPSEAPRAATVVGDDGKTRCVWAGNDPDYRPYHDNEWGKPLHSDQRLYEKICLEGFQAGLSWITILRRREAFRTAFAQFDIDTVAEFDDADVERLVVDASIIRHRGKILAAISNARAARELIDQTGDGALDALIWSFRPQTPPPRPRTLADFVATTPESVALSKELRARGFRFVGPTTMYALMQSAGLVDDHVVGCFCATA